MAEFTEDFKIQAKQELLGLAETVSTEAVKTVFKLAELAVKDSNNKFDDLLLPALPKLEEIVLGFVDEIKK